jgi:glucokinase
MTKTGLGIDIGGSTVKWTVIDPEGGLEPVQRLPTPREPETLLRALEQLVHRVEREYGGPQQLCVGTPGPVDERGAIQGVAVNLRGWGNRPLQESLGERLELPVIVKNDTNLALVAESLRGSAQGSRNVLGVFLGTGIGGGLFLNGRLYEGHHGLAGEIGHTVVVPSGTPCGCGQRGCLERYAASAGLRTQVALESEGKEDTAFSVPTFFARVAAGDALETRVYRRAVDALARGIGVAAGVLAPETVVIGGGLVEAYPHLVPDTAKAMADYTLPAIGRQLSVVRAGLGADAGAVGAALVSVGRGVTT